MKSFTPLFDCMTTEYGIVTSAVYGYVWRCCQLDRGVCDASFQTIANDLGITRRTVITHIRKLVNDQIIEDLTPNAGTRPHKYLVKEIHQTSELNSPPSEIVSLALVKEIHQTSELNSPKDTETYKDTITSADVYSVYQDRIGSLDRMLSDDIGDWFDDVGGKWIIDAIDIAVKANVRNWRYVEGVLKRWKVSGRQDSIKLNSNGKVKVDNETGGVYV